MSRIAGALICLSCCIVSGQTYRVRVLNPLPGDSSTSGVAVNNYGDVLGWSYTSNGQSHPVIWGPISAPGSGPGGILDLTLKLPANVYEITSMNDARTVVGTTRFLLGGGSGESIRTGFVWDAGNGSRTLTPYPQLDNVYRLEVSPIAVTNSGVIAATEDAYGQVSWLEYPVLYHTPGIPEKVPTSPLIKVGLRAYNDWGFAVDGYYYLVDTTTGALKLIAEEFLPNGLDNGMHYVVGTIVDPSVNIITTDYPWAHAGLYRYDCWNCPGELKDLGTLPGGLYASAVGVNHLRQVIGTSDCPADLLHCPDGRTAFLWDEANGMRPLGAAIMQPAHTFAVLQKPVSILGTGEILVNGLLYTVDAQGYAHFPVQRGFLLIRDDAPPDVKCVAPDNAWHGANVSVSCAATDAKAGLLYEADSSFAVFTHVPAGTESTTAMTAQRSVCDAVENCVTVGPFGPVKVDLKPPTAACSAADANWHADNVTIPCTASDTGSGLANPALAYLLRTNVQSGQESGNAATNQTTICDNVGNCVYAGPVGGNKIDRRPPSIFVSTPASGEFVFLNQNVTTHYTCSDGGSGVASCTAPVADGAPAPTNSVGVKTVNVTAKDNVGNTQTFGSSYNVTYRICLQYDSSAAFRGSAIGLRLALCDAAGVNVSSAQVQLTAVGLGPAGVAKSPGNSNPANTFRFLGQGYEYQLDTGGLPAGSYVLRFQVTGDPRVQQAPFVLR